MESLQFIGTTPEKLRAGIAEDVERKIMALYKKKEDPEELLTKDEAAKFFKVNLSTITNWMNNGKLKAYQIGNRVYFKKNELMASLTAIK